MDPYPRRDADLVDATPGNIEKKDPLHDPGKDPIFEGQDTILFSPNSLSYIYSPLPYDRVTTFLNSLARRYGYTYICYPKRAN
jgi:hypothetical protein